jgi:hypothetical protein
MPTSMMPLRAAASMNICGPLSTRKDKSYREKKNTDIL